MFFFGCFALLCLALAALAALACFGLLGLLWLLALSVPLLLRFYRAGSVDLWGGVLVPFFAVFRNFFDILTHLKLSYIFVVIFGAFS